MTHLFNLRKIISYPPDKCRYWDFEIDNQRIFGKVTHQQQKIIRIGGIKKPGYAMGLRGEY